MNDLKDPDVLWPDVVGGGSHSYTKHFGGVSVALNLKESYFRVNGAKNDFVVPKKIVGHKKERKLILR